MLLVKSLAACAAHIVLSMCRVAPLEQIKMMMMMMMMVKTESRDRHYKQLN